MIPRLAMVANGRRDRRRGRTRQILLANGFRGGRGGMAGIFTAARHEPPQPSKCRFPRLGMPFRPQNGLAGRKGIEPAPKGIHPAPRGIDTLPKGIHPGGKGMAPRAKRYPSRAKRYSYRRAGDQARAAGYSSRAADLRTRRVRQPAREARSSHRGEGGFIGPPPMTAAARSPRRAREPGAFAACRR